MARNHRHITSLFLLFVEFQIYIFPVEIKTWPIKKVFPTEQTGILQNSLTFLIVCDFKAIKQTLIILTFIQLYCKNNCILL
jgi:hypothetical protein